MQDMLTALLISASLGALLGLERQWSGERDNPQSEPALGVRTFALWATLGALCAWFGSEAQPGLFLAGFVGMIVFLSLLHLRSPAPEGNPGLTTSAVGLATYLLGGLVLLGNARSAVIITVSILLVLSSKKWLHGLSRRFSPTDVSQALQFAAVTGIILPLVPDRDFGPFGAFNPFTIWLMVVLVSGLGFLGYVAVRVFGENRGLAFTGLLGGLASSTATTLAMSRQSRAQPRSGHLCALAVVLACTVMLGRVAVLAGAVSPPTAWQIAPWLLLMATPALIFAAWSWKKYPMAVAGDTPPNAARNPLSLRIAVQFGVLYALVVLAVRWAEHTFGGSGVYWASFFSGLTDLDAIALSLSQLERSGNISCVDAARAILIAAGANSLLKASLALALGSPTLRRPVGLVLGVTILLAGLAAWLV
jgi:uncharacterized membrane protein (DUF4010 family)